jgi:hypothetical protein
MSSFAPGTSGMDMAVANFKMGMGLDDRYLNPDGTPKAGVPANIPQPTYAGGSGMTALRNLLSTNPQAQGMGQQSQSQPMVGPNGNIMRPPTQQQAPFDPAMVLQMARANGGQKANDPFQQLLGQLGSPSQPPITGSALTNSPIVQGTQSPLTEQQMVRVNMAGSQGGMSSLPAPGSLDANGNPTNGGFAPQYTDASGRPSYVDMSDPAVAAAMNAPGGPTTAQNAGGQGYFSTQGQQQQMSSLQGSFTPGALDANGNPTNGGYNPNGMYTGGQQQQPPPQTGAQNTAGTQAQTTATGAPETAVDPYGNPVAPVAPPPVNYGSAPPIGLAGSEAALRGGLEGSLSALNQGFGAAYRNVGQTYGTDQIEAARRQAAANTRQGVAGYKPFLSAGQDSVQLQAAISGALGPEAQAQAFADMQTSPEQKFIEDRQQRALLAASSAIGGLGGGNVLTALQEQGAGFASQNIADRIARLNQLSTLGINAAQGGGNLLGQDSQLQMQGAMKQADIQGQRAQTMATLGQNKALTMADLLTGAGRDVAQGRTNAGNAISDAIGNTTSALANLQNQQGAGTADIIGSATDQLANIGINAGEGLANDQQALAVMLANLATQQGTQLGNVLTSRGGQESTGKPGLLELLGNFAQQA